MVPYLLTSKTCQLLTRWMHARVEWGVYIENMFLFTEITMYTTYAYGEERDYWAIHSWESDGRDTNEFSPKTN